MKLSTLALAATALCACGQARSLERELAELTRLSGEARTRGAHECAPEELARAEAHLDFARAELELGDAPRAREHLVLAFANTHAAWRRSRETSCTRENRSGPEARGPRFRNLPSRSREPARANLHHGSTRQHAAM